MWYSRNLPIIDGAVDKSILFLCSEREHNRLKYGVYFVQCSVSDIRAKSRTSGRSLFNSAGNGLLKMLLTLSKWRSCFIWRVTRLPLLQSKGLTRLQSPHQRSFLTVICVIPTLVAKQTTRKKKGKSHRCFANQMVKVREREHLDKKKRGVNA